MENELKRKKEVHQFNIVSTFLQILNFTKNLKFILQMLVNQLISFKKILHTYKACQKRRNAQTLAGECVMQQAMQH